MFSRLLKHLSMLSLGVGQIQAASSNNYTANAEAAYTTLQQWYNSTSGIYDTTGWWNSANCLTVLGDLAVVDSSVKSDVTNVFANSIVAAQDYNLGQTKIITADYNIQTIWASENSSVEVINPKGFLNGFYDDEGWWALAWIQAYDVTGDEEYLTTAVDIFTDMTNGSTTPCSTSGSGIWWDKSQTYVNAIANELYLSVASHLANRVPAQKSSYLTIAQAQWTWFQQSGMINSQNLINDGLSTACINNNESVWSYNQGVILGALVEMNKASPDSTYLASANNIAKAAIEALSDSGGVLHESCEPDCGADGSQFKGIFMRNLQLLQTASPDASYLEFIATNAESIWNNDRNVQNMLSEDWAGPFIATANASTHSCAMDALVAAAAFEADLEDSIVSS